MRKNQRLLSSPSSHSSEDSNSPQFAASPLKQYDFSSNHTEDKSLFDVILAGVDYETQILNPPQKIQKKRGRKKKSALISVISTIVYDPSLAASNKYLQIQLDQESLDEKRPFQEDDLFCESLNRKHQGELGSKGDVQDMQEKLQKQVGNRPQIKKVKIRSERIFRRKMIEKTNHWNIRENWHYQTFKNRNAKKSYQKETITKNNYEQYLNL